MSPDRAPPCLAAATGHGIRSGSSPSSTAGAATPVRSRGNRSDISEKWRRSEARVPSPTAGSVRARQLLRHPYAHQGKQLLDVHGLGNIVVRARRQALVMIVRHGLGGDRNDGQVFPFGALANLAHGGESI